jgi:hypothetical protein
MAVFITAQALATAVLTFTDDPVVFTVAALLWQTCQLPVLVQMLAAALIDPTDRLVASFSVAGALGTGIGPLAVGTILDGAGADALSLVLALGTYVTSLPLLRMTVASGIGHRRTTARTRADALRTPSRPRRTAAVPVRCQGQRLSVCRGPVALAASSPSWGADIASGRR